LSESENVARQLELQALAERMGKVRHKILVLSGKGCVWKTTVAVNLAVALARQGYRVGLLDVDIHGPNVAKLLNLEDARITVVDDEIIPVGWGPNLKVISMAFLLANRNEAVIWRGPLKMKVIEQFLKDVRWGELDYLVVDAPPGTGDEPLSVAQLIADADGAVLVTTPQELALLDVSKCVNFCKQLSLPVLGLVENMSAFVCPTCGNTVEVFNVGGAKTLAARLGIAFLGRIPLDPAVSKGGDSGTPFADCASQDVTTRAFATIVQSLIKATTRQDDVLEREPSKEVGTMKFAIPVARGQLCMHFGHCEQFALVDADPAAKTIGNVVFEEAPDHEPGLLPRWLAERGVTTVIAGGMGGRAQSLFAEHNINVVVGASPGEDPKTIVEAYLAGMLTTGDNICSH